MTKTKTKTKTKTTFTLEAAMQPCLRGGLLYADYLQAARRACLGIAAHHGRG